MKVSQAENLMMSLHAPQGSSSTFPVLLYWFISAMRNVEPALPNTNCRTVGR